MTGALGATPAHVRWRAGWALLVTVLSAAAGGCAPPARRATTALGTATVERGPDGDVAALIDRALRRYAMHGLSGSAWVAEGGAVRLAAGYGLADRASGTPASAATRYDVGSVTKTFTAAAVLRLVAAGRLRLDQPVGAALGVAPGAVPPDWRAVTVHHLLTHSAGLPLDPADAGIRADDPPEAFVAKALAAPPLGAPGAAYRYSNLGYGLLALAVERASGRPFRAHVTEQFVGPLGLTATAWWGDDAAMAVPNAAVGYEWDDRALALVPEPPVRRGGPGAPVWGKWPLGAAGVVTTAGDLGRWADALLGGRALPDSLTRRVASVQSAPGDQAYGWTVDARPGVGRRVFRGGGRTGFTSLLAHYPDRRVTVAYALNQAATVGWQTLVTRSVERALAGLPDTLPPATVAATPALLRRFVGGWAVAPGARVRVEADGETLLVGAEGQAAVDALLDPGARGDQRFAAQNAAAPALLRAALRADARQDTAPALRAVPRPAEFRAWARARIGDTLALVVLGTTPHPSGRGRTQTFVRTGAADDAPVVRLISEGGRVIAWADGVRWPALARYRVVSADEAVAFTPAAPGWASLLRADPGGQPGLALRGADGARSAVFPRAAGP